MSSRAKEKPFTEGNLSGLDQCRERVFPFKGTPGDRRRKPNTLGSRQLSRPAKMGVKVLFQLDIPLKGAVLRGASFKTIRKKREPSKKKEEADSASAFFCQAAYLQSSPWAPAKTPWQKAGSFGELTGRDLRGVV